MALYYGSNKSTPIIVKMVSGTNVTKLSELENDVGFITNEAIKTTIQSISSTQEEEILNSGTLDGVEVENGKIFACDYGNMKIYSKTETSGGNSGLFWDSLGNIGLTEMSPHSPAIEPISGTAVVTIDGYSSAWVGMINGGGPAWERVDDVVSNGFVTGNGSLLSNFPLSDCIHNGVEFIHYGNSYISRSQDGRTWTQEEYPNGSPFMKISGVAVDGNLNYVVSDDTEGKIFHSTDGINFTDTGYKGKVQPLSHGVFIATQDDNHILESHDGLHWNTINIPMNGMIGAQCIMMNGTYVWIASPSVATQSVYYSTDGGSTWNESLLPFSLNPRLSYCGDKFIILDGSTSRREIVYSYDGINWYTALMDVEDVWYMTYFSKGVFGIAGSYAFETTTSTNWGGSNDSSEQPTYTYSLDTISPNMSDVHLAIDNASYIGVLDTTTVYSYLYNKYEGSICYASEDGEYVLDYTGETRYYKKGHFYKIATMWGGENSEYYIRYFEDITQDDSQYTRKLDVEHAEQIVLDGTFDGVEVEDGEIFVQHNGKLVEFDKTLNPGGDWYSVMLPTTNPSSSGGPYDGVCYGNGIFVAVNQYLRSSNSNNYSYVATSTNGKDWVEHTNALDWTPSTFTESRSYFKVFFTETRADVRQGLFFMPHEGSGNYLTTSFDGENWTEVPVTVETQYITDIVYFKNRFILSSKSVGIMIANDGYINWTGVSGVPAGNYKLAVSPNRIIAVKSNEYANQFYYTDDGVNWESGTLLGNNYYQDIAYGKGKFVITTGTTSYSRDTVLYSEDGGVNWNTSTMPSSGGWTNVIYDETTGLFISVDGMASSDAGAYSEDGVNWTKFTRPQGVINRYGLTSGNGVVVAVPTNPSGSSDLTPRIFYANYTPFYEYGLVDLSYTKEEIDNQIGNIGFILDALNGEVI